MLQYLLIQPVKIVFEPGAIRNLGELLRSQELQKPLIVTDKGIVAAGIAKKVTDVLDAEKFDYVLYDKVLPDAPVEFVEEGFKLSQDEKCDAVIALGGGSTIDTAKAINLLRFNDGPILRFTDFSTPMNPCKGLISVPTTSGTGSELSDGILLSDEQHNKRPILAPKAMSEFAIIDPELTIGMPPHLTAATGFDALAHAIECCTSNLANMLVDQIALGICKTIVQWLPVAVNDGDNVEARAHMSICAALSGWMLAYGHSNAGHSIGHILGAKYNIPHGLACAYATPLVIEFNAELIPERTKTIGELFGLQFSGKESPGEIGKMTADAIRKFRDETLKIKQASEFEHYPASYDDAAEAIVNEGFQIFNVRKMEKSDALEILQKIFS